MDWNEWEDGTRGGLDTPPLFRVSGFRSLWEEGYPLPIGDVREKDVSRFEGFPL